MREGWEIKKLLDVVDFQRGLTYSKNDEVDFSENMVLRSNNIDLKTNKLDFTEIRYINPEIVIPENKKVTKGSLIICTANGSKSHLGKVALIDDDYNYAFGGFMGLIKPKGNLNSDFLFHLLTSEPYKKFIGALSDGANINNLKFGDLGEFEIPLPPLPEQQRIVAILDEAFAAIDKAKANAEKNLKSAKELFESYLQGVFENGIWEKKKWGDLCEFVRGPFGGSLKKNIFKDDGYVVYEQKHAIHDHFNQLRYFIDEEKFKEMKRFELFPGDLIMSCSGVTLGRVAIVPYGIKRGIINQALLKLTPKKNVSVNFIKHWLRSRIFQNIIFSYAGGAAIPNVPSAKILKGVLIPFPSLIEQELKVCEIEKVSAETKKLEAIYLQKLTDLEELKKSILQKAFSGELNTKEICA